MPRVRIATNIWEDDRVRIAIAKVGTLRREKSFPRSRGVREIQAWIDSTKSEFRKRRDRRRKTQGTLQGDVLEYLETLPPGRPRRDVASNLAAWLEVLGDVRRSRLTIERLQTVVNDWIADGVAVSTVKHRRRALAQLYDALDGAEAPNPARAIKTPREPQGEVRAIDVDVLAAILATMDTHRTHRHPGRGGRGFKNKAQARLMMMLGTGITPASLHRLRPERIDLARETLTLPPRLKGEGAESVTVPLFPYGVLACRAWLRAFAWGRFDQRALGRSFHAAVRRYVAQEGAAGRTVALPGDLRVYDLRHSFLSWLWRETEDLLLVQHYAQHADLETTRRYVRGAVDRRMATVAARVKAKQAS